MFLEWNQTLEGLMAKYEFERSFHSTFDTSCYFFFLLCILQETREEKFLDPAPPRLEHPSRQLKFDSQQQQMGILINILRQAETMDLQVYRGSVYFQPTPRRFPDE